MKKAQTLEGDKKVEKSRLIANNTIEYWQDGARVIRLHGIDIIRYNADGSVTLNSGGWRTPTTRDRLNRFTPFHVHQKDGIWYLQINGKKYVFEDGITIHPDGEVKGAGPDPEELKMLDKRIKKYVNDYMKQLIARNLSQPSRGDCWYCFLRTQDNTPLGEATQGRQRLLAHIEESYFVPSLVINAIEHFGGLSQIARHYVGYWLHYHDQAAGWGEDIARQQVKTALLRYMRSQLGLAR
jgi:hypothetical protein